MANKNLFTKDNFKLDCHSSYSNNHIIDFFKQSQSGEHQDRKELLLFRTVIPHDEEFGALELPS